MCGTNFRFSNQFRYYILTGKQCTTIFDSWQWTWCMDDKCAKIVALLHIMYLPHYRCHLTVSMECVRLIYHIFLLNDSWCRKHEFNSKFQRKEVELDSANNLEQFTLLPWVKVKNSWNFNNSSINFNYNSRLTWHECSELDWNPKFIMNFSEILILAKIKSHRRSFVFVALFLFCISFFCLLIN